MANTVTLTFAGDTKPAEDAFSRVGSASRDMGRAVDESGDSFDRAAEKSDTLDTRAMGFRDTLTGIQDGAKGVKQAAAGDWGFETLLLLGTGVGDLASGLTNFLIPALKATRIGQLLLNTAWLTSPITWIILGIVALIAVIVLIATKTDWFQRAWRASWGWIRNAAGSAWTWIRTASSNALAFMQRIPGRIGAAFRTLATIITTPYRVAFNGIAWLWNNTIGRLSWSVPSWVPFIGGNTISVPKLPTFHAGGVVPGVVGTAVPILAQAGERVGGVASGRPREEWVRVDLGELGDALLGTIAKAVSRRGGQVTHLGVRVVNGAVRA